MSGGETRLAEGHGIWNALRGSQQVTADGEEENGEPQKVFDKKNFLGKVNVRDQLCILLEEEGSGSRGTGDAGLA